jgi:hypothetical protein
MVPGVAQCHSAESVVSDPATVVTILRWLFDSFETDSGSPFHPFPNLIGRSNLALSSLARANQLLHGDDLDNKDVQFND